jgi:hypothetical protein
MELYVRFMFTLAIGLIGVGVLLTTVFETLLHDWDPARDIRRWWRTLNASRSHASEIRAEDILEQLQARRTGAAVSSSSRVIDRRREALRSVSEAERRLAVPRAA